MRKFPILALSALAALALAGCNKEESASFKGDANVVFRITSAAPVTKATDFTDSVEARVNSLQVFVFKDDGSRETYGTAENTKSLSLTCSQGAKTVWALVNVESLADIQTLSDLKAVAVNLSDLKAGSFAMGGAVEQSISEATATVTVPVSRYSSRIVIRKITNNFKSEALRDKEFKVTGIYVTNAQGRNSLGLDAYQAASGIWYNQMKYESANSLPVLYDAVDTAVAYGASVALEHRFYALPNDVKADDDVHAGTWTPRCTRLVIETTLDGRTKYYPVTMDQGFERNKSYEIDELVITKSGSDDPDKPVSSEDVTFSINVVDWTVVLMGNEGTVTI